MNLNPADEEVALALLLADEDELAKAASIDRGRPVVAHARAAIETTLRTFLTHLALRLAIGARGIAKAEEGKDDPVIGAAESTDWTTVQDGVRPQLQMVARDAARLGLHQVGGGMDRLLTQADPRAITWANERAAELVTEIGDTTRQGVRDLVARAIEEGWSNETLAEQLLEAGAFSGARAERIARTETAFADVAGNLIGWKASGVVSQKEWKVADSGECPLCADMDGEVVGIDEDFDFDGEMIEGPPGHVNCRCDVLPVLADEAET